MAKKNKKNRPRQRKPATPPKFRVGDQVVVKVGTPDPNFSDIPLGGWSGTIREVDTRTQLTLYVIDWNKHTLQNLPDIYRKRCERDDLDETAICLAESDLQLARDRPVKMEQPTNIVTRPLKKTNKEDRIRAIFGLTSNDPLPPVDEKSLATYHRYLSRHLSFPFQAKYYLQTGAFELEEHRVEVVELLDAGECDDEDGLLCEAVQDHEPVELAVCEIDVTVNIHNQQLIKDYTYWFGNWQDAGEFNEGRAGATVRVVSSGEPGLLQLLLRKTIWGGVYGVLLGILFFTVEATRLGAGIGAFLLAAIGFWVSATRGLSTETDDMYDLGRVWNGLVGFVLGALIGAPVAAMLVALVVAATGAVIGGLVGGVLGFLGNSEAYRQRAVLVCVFVGACVGAYVQILVQHWQQALWGAAWGVLIGCVSGALLYLGVIGISFVFIKRKMSK